MRKIVWYRILKIPLIALALAMATQASAQLTVAQTYFVPLPEDQVQETLATLNPKSYQYHD